ncbi:MAG: DNA primase [Bernardetiaceae bacterium]|nr:DNA primase [Bernardetiaceae bacterium]
MPAHIIDRIKTSALIEEVISDFLPLQKKGQNLWACCPFHDEKSPSFSVAPSKGIFKCFGCGKAGDSITFVMEHEGVSYPEAIRYLADKYHIEIPEGSREEQEEAQAEEKQRESLLIALKFGHDYFQNKLWESDEGKSIGLSYFKERGFHERTIKRFELGYSLDDWHALETQAIAQKYSPDILEEAGLIIKKEGKQYDRFRGRVMFPIHNLSGRVIGFGARTLRKDDKPKYLNSPESLVYEKSKVLYGLFQAKQEIRKQDESLMVEGYTDVISLAQEGIENVVASSGTSLTEGQIKLLKRFSTNITVIYDGDNAGLKAAMRGIDLILAEGMDVRAIALPEGQDPDSQVRKMGGEAFKAYIQREKKDFLRFKTEIYLKETANDPIAKAKAIGEIVRSIIKIPDAIKRMMFFKQCSEMLAVDEQTLVSEGNKILNRERLEEQRRNKRTQQAEKNKDISPPPADGIPLPDISAMPEELLDDIEGLPPITITEKIPLTEDKKESKSISKTSLELYEQELMRLMIRYGYIAIEAEYYVAQYILEEMQVMPTNPHLATIYKTFVEAVQRGERPPSPEQLLHTIDADAQHTASNLLLDRHVISPNWEKRYDIYTPHESDILNKVSYRNLLHLKLRILQKLEKENLEHIRKAESDTAALELLKTHQQLKIAIKEIAELLEIVIYNKN